MPTKEISIFQLNVGLGLLLGRLKLDYALANVGNVSGAQASHIFSVSLDLSEKKVLHNNATSKTYFGCWASENPQRYSNIATKRLVLHGHPVIAYGTERRNDRRNTHFQSWPQHVDIDTVALYVGPERQADLISQIIALQLKESSFNPGPKNPAFYNQLDLAGINYVGGVYAGLA